MTKSKKLRRAMLAVVDTNLFSAADKLDILEVLASAKNREEMLEEYQRKQEEVKNG